MTPRTVWKTKNNNTPVMHYSEWWSFKNITLSLKRISNEQNKTLVTHHWIVCALSWADYKHIHTHNAMMCRFPITYQKNSFCHISWVLCFSADCKYFRVISGNTFTRENTLAGSTSTTRAHLREKWTPRAKTMTFYKQQLGNVNRGSGRDDRKDRRVSWLLSAEWCPLCSLLVWASCSRMAEAGLWGPVLD